MAEQPKAVPTEVDVAEYIAGVEPERRRAEARPPLQTGSGA
jgi:hypothetical protein